MEVMEALGAEELAGDDGGATAGETVGDDSVGDGDAEAALESARGGVAEERGRVVHEGVEAAQAGERGMQRGLIAGGERVGRTGGEGVEIAAEGADSAADASAGPELNDGERVGRVLREVAVVGVGDDVAGEIALMQPAGEGEDAALAAAELLNLGDDDGAGGGDGGGFGHGSAEGEGVEACEKFREGDGGGFGAEYLGVAGGAQGGDGEGHGDAMVGAGVDGGAVEDLVAGDLEAVGVLGEARAHGAEIFGDESDAVGLLDAKFLGVANDYAIRGVGSDGGKDGKLVDELRGEWAADEEAGWWRCGGRS